MRHLQRAFTLIEILVVLVVMALLSALLLLNFAGGLGENRELERDVRRLGALMGLASEEAAMQGREFGLRFSERAYAFYDLDFETGAWVELTGDDMLRSREFAEDVELILVIDEQQVVLDAELDDYQDPDEADNEDTEQSEIVIAPPPHVALLSSGETTPFELIVRERFNDRELKLEGDDFGGVEFSASGGL